jgi:hypothetical protein
VSGARVPADGRGARPLDDPAVLRGLRSPTLRGVALTAMGWRLVAAEAARVIGEAAAGEEAVRAAQVRGVLDEAVRMSGDERWGAGRHVSAIRAAVKILMSLRGATEQEIAAALEPYPPE